MSHTKMWSKVGKSIGQASSLPIHSAASIPAGFRSPMSLHSAWSIMATGSPVFLPKQQPIPPRKQAARQPLRALPLPLYAQRSRRPPAQRQKQLPSPTLRHLLVPVRIAAEMEKCPAVAAIAAGMEISSVTVPTAAETANAIASPATAKDTMTAPAAAEMASAAAGAATAPVKTGRMTAATAAAETAKSSVPAAAVAETNLRVPL